MKSSPIIKLTLIGAVIALLAGAAASFYLYQQGAGEGAATVAGSALPDLAATRKDAEGGDAEAQCVLGEIYQEGKQTKPDYEEAARWYRKSADNKYVRAQYNLGQLYDIGRGVPHDETEAAKWYRMAAENDYMEAQYIYASMCSLGRGVTMNVGEALKWYHRAAEHGDGLSMFQLAERYERARGVAEDLAEAYFWHTLAAGRGIQDAREAITRLDSQVPSEKRADVKKRADEFKAKHGKDWTTP